MSDSGPDSVIRLCRLDVRFEPDMSVIDVAVRPELSGTVPLLSRVPVPVVRPSHPHRIEAELISALAMGTNLDVAAADQSRPSATRAAKLTHPMRRIFHPSSLGKMGLAHFSPSECEVAHTSRGTAPPQRRPLMRYFGPDA